MMRGISRSMRSDLPHDGGQGIEPGLGQAGQAVQGMESPAAFDGQRGGDISLQGAAQGVKRLLVPGKEPAAKGIPRPGEIGQARRVGGYFPAFF